MATYDVKEISRSGAIDDKGVRTYTRVFRVITSNPGDGPLLITAQVPFVLYETYNLGPGNDLDLAAILKRVDTQPEDVLAGIWQVTMTYDTAQNAVDKGTVQPGTTDTPPGGGSGTPGTGNNQTPPDQRPWTLRWGSVQTDRLLVKDLSEEEAPVVNSAGQPFDPPISLPSANTTLSITGFTAVGDGSKIKRYMNKVNEHAFLGWDPGEARCTQYQLTSVYENGAFFWQVDVTIEFKDGGWNPVEVLDAGTLYKKSASLPLQPILDRAGNPVTAPVPLNGFGEPLTAGADPVYLEFQGYATVDFANLI